MAFKNLVMLAMFTGSIFAQQENKNEPLGIVIYLRASIETKGDKVIKQGDLLYKGDAVNLGQGDYCKVFWADGSVKEYKKKFNVPDLKPLRKEIMAMFAEHATTQSWFSKAQSHYSKQIYRSDTEASLSAITPRNTRLIDIPTQLIWRHIPDKITGASEFVVHLRSYENDYSFEETVLGNSFTFRNEMNMERGIKYFWFTEAVNENINEATESVWFYVMNKEDRAEFENALRESNDAIELTENPVLKKLLTATIYMRYQLYKDALEITASVLNEQPHHIMALKIQARIYEIIEQPVETKRLLEITQRYMENQ
ncbi:hypothetical protein L6Q79_05795 [bacterium]|nr:hypothetical protein [bacterium]NUN44456.1 hypothetical protein [bacterium]